MDFYNAGQDAVIPPIEYYWGQIADQTVGMSMDEFERGWREMSPDDDMEIIAGTFNQYDGDANTFLD